MTSRNCFWIRRIGRYLDIKQTANRRTNSTKYASPSRERTRSTTCWSWTGRTHREGGVAQALSCASINKCLCGSPRSITTWAGCGRRRRGYSCRAASPSKLLWGSGMRTFTYSTRTSQGRGFWARPRAAGTCRSKGWVSFCPQFDHYFPSVESVLSWFNYLNTYHRITAYECER